MNFASSFCVACLLSCAFVEQPLLGTLSTSAAFADEANFNGEPVAVIGDSSALTIASNKVSGTGSFVYQAKLDSIGQESSHALSFSLKDGGKLNFVAYADPTLGQGLEFIFTRQGNALKGRIVKDGELSSALDVSAELANINAARVVSLQIDVHNSEAPAHLLIWDGLESEFLEDNALLNTEEVSEGAPGKGAGLRRGFKLKDATLLKAVATEPKFRH